MFFLYMECGHIDHNKTFIRFNKYEVKKVLPINDQKKQFILYFGVYFMTQMMYIYINAYLPIYFTSASVVNVHELGILLFASFSLMLVKPALSIYFDRVSRKSGTSSKVLDKRTFLILGSAGAGASFAILLFSTELVIVFMIVLGSNLAFISLMDVTIDKIILLNSPNEVLKNKNAFYLQLGGIIGAIIPNVYYFVLMEDRTLMAPWISFFIAGIITIFLTFPVIFLMKEKETKKIEEPRATSPPGAIPVNTILFMSAFMFLLYGTFLYDWVLEPWAVKKLDSDSLFALIMIAFIVLDVLSLIVAMKFARRLDKRKLLLILVFISGVLTIIAPLSGIVVFIAMQVILQLISGFIIIAMTTLMFDISHDRVLFFQIIAAFAILAKVILAPLGLLLSTSIPGEYIIACAGILQAISIIPLYFVKNA